MADQTTTPSVGWQNKFSTTLTSGITSTDTTIPLNALPTPSEGFLVIEPDSSTNWEVIYYTSKTGSAVVCTSAANGRGVDDSTAISHSQGATVRMDTTAGMFEALQGATALAGVHQMNIDRGSNFVSSGCIWTADSAGSTLLGSMTSGVVYINGRRHTVATVTSRAFTASKDTYVDLLYSTTNNIATPVYTEVTNNVASPALAANSVRIATVVTAAGSIAATTSIGQGGFANTTPTISSQIFKGFDSLGNLIYPKGPTTPVLQQNPYKFSVYRIAALTPAGSAILTCDTKEYDTGNNVDVTTNKGRFTVPVAGYYRFNAQITTAAAARSLIMLFKNGAEVKRGNDFTAGAGGGGAVISVDVQAAANDYFEIGVNTGSTALTVGSAAFCWFQGSLISAS